MYGMKSILLGDSFDIIYIFQSSSCCSISPSWIDCINGTVSGSWSAHIECKETWKIIPRFLA